MTLAQDIASLSERSRHFDRAIEASKANDQRAFDEAINAFWNVSQGSGRVVNTLPVNE